MRGIRRKAAIAVSIVAASAVAAGGVLAATQSSDEEALAPARHGGDGGVERRVDNLLKRMTLDEKLQQIQLLSDGQITDDDARKGVGGVFSLVDPVKINHFQQVAVEESRLHIPILFAYDTIHGYRTIFPIPLGAASSFDPDVATADDTIARARDRDRRHQADLQPDGRRLARAALGPDLRGRGRGPVPGLGLSRPRA